MNNKLKLLFSMILVVGTIMMLSGCGARKVNLNDCIDYSFEGWDGYGEVVSSVDDTLLRTAMGTESLFSDYLDICSKIEGNWDVTEDLCNGDEITYKWNIDKEDIKAIKKKYKIKLEYKDFTVTVKDLKDVSEFDVRDGLDVSFSGVAPNGTAHVVCNFQDLTATIDNPSGLSNGDEITITLEPKYLDGNLKEICKINKIPFIEETEIRYTVEGLSSYVTSPEEIPSDVMEIMKAIAEEKINKLYEQSECDTYNRGSWFINYYKHHDFKNVSFDNVYIKAAEPREYNSQPNRVYLVYKITYEDHGSQDAYLSVYFSGITDSNSGLTEKDIEEAASRVDGQNNYIENPDTQCKYMGYSKDELNSYLENNGVIVSDDASNNYQESLTIPSNISARNLGKEEYAEKMGVESEFVGDGVACIFEWDTCEGTTGYECKITVQDPTGDPATERTTECKTEYLIESTWACPTTYFLSIRAYKENDGGTKEYSEWSQPFEYVLE